MAEEMNDLDRIIAQLDGLEHRIEKIETRLDMEGVGESVSIASDLYQTEQYEPSAATTNSVISEIKNVLERESTSHDEPPLDHAAQIDRVADLLVTEYGYDRDRVEHLLARLERQGEIYKPADGYVTLV